MVNPQSEVDLPQSAIEEIDGICSDFERSLKTGESPAISDFLERLSSGALRKNLFGKLLATDCAYLHQSGHEINFESLYLRFPEWATVIDAERAKRRELSIETTKTYLTNDVETTKSFLVGELSNIPKPNAGSSDEANIADSRFRILGKHAKGGLGEVFLARDERLGRQVALKEIQHQYANSATSRHRFLREAEITGKLEHPGIVPIYGLGQRADGRPFYAMRFVQGETLSQAIAKLHSQDSRSRGSARRWLFELRKLLSRFIAVCNAMEYAHSKGVIHRDLKPANIMLGDFGETLVVDWGLARMLDGDGQVTSMLDDLETVNSNSPSGATSEFDASPTRTGDVMGTLGYMGPEQAAGRTDTTGPSWDIYSLGATLYAILTGHAPHLRGTAKEMLEAIQLGNFKRPRATKAEVPVALEAICLKAMALDPAARYESSKALALDVEKFLADEPVTAHRETLLQAWSRISRRYASWVQAGGVALALVATIAIVAGLSVNAARQKAVALADSNKKLADTNGRLAVDAKAAADRAIDLANSNLQLASSERFARIEAELKAVDLLYERASQYSKRGEVAEAVGLLGTLVEKVDKIAQESGQYVEGRDTLEENPLAAQQRDTIASWDQLIRQVLAAYMLEIPWLESITPRKMSTAPLAYHSRTLPPGLKVSGSPGLLIMVSESASGLPIGIPIDIMGRLNREKWANVTGQQRARLERPTINVSFDRKQLLAQVPYTLAPSNLKGSVVGVWNLATAEPVGRLIDFSSEGSRLPDGFQINHKDVEVCFAEEPGKLVAMVRGDDYDSRRLVTIDLESQTFLDDGIAISGYPVLFASPSGPRIITKERHLGAVTAEISGGDKFIPPQVTNTISLWDFSRRSRIGEPLQIDGAIQSEVVSPQGDFFGFLVDVPRPITFYNSNSAEPSGPKFTQPAKSLIFSPRGNELLVLGENAIWLFEFPSGKQVASSPEVGSTTLRFSDDFRAIYTAHFFQPGTTYAWSGAKEISQGSIWDKQNGPLIKFRLVHEHCTYPDLGGFEANQSSLDFLTGKLRTVTGTNYGDMAFNYVWHIPYEVQPVFLTEHDYRSGFPKIYLNRNGRYTLLVGEKRVANRAIGAVWVGQQTSGQVWDVTTGKPIGAKLTLPANFNGAAIDNDGSRLSIWHNYYGTASFWNVADGKRIGAEIKIGATTFESQEWHAFDMDESGKIVAGINASDHLWLWDLDTGKQLGQYPQISAIQTSGSLNGADAFLSPDGSRLFYQSKAGFHVLDLATMKRVDQWGERGYSRFSVSESGTRVATSQGFLMTLPPDKVNNLIVEKNLADYRICISPDGRWLATGKDEWVRHWDADTGKLIAKLGPLPGVVSCVSYNSEGNLLAVGCSNGSVQLWDMHRFLPIGNPWNHPQPIKVLRFVKGTSYLAIGTTAQEGSSLEVGLDTLVVRPLPPALSGTGRRMRLWAESISGVHVDENLNVAPITPDDWLSNRDELVKLGGAPPEWLTLADQQRRVQQEFILNEAENQSLAP